MGLFSHIFKSVVKAVKIVGPAAIGFAIGGPVGASVGLGITAASMGAFKPPKVPKPYVPPPPKIDSPEVQAKLLEAKKKVAKVYAGLGRSSTILTGGKGVQGAAPIWRKTLLGE